MEELIPIVFIIVIAISQVLKQVVEKQNRKPSDQPEDKPSRTQNESGSLEEFFNDIARKLGPQQPDLAEWPESVERPDYVQEMEEYESARIEPAKAPRPIDPVSVPPEIPTSSPMSMPTKGTVAQSRGLARTRSFRLTSQDTALTGMSGSRIAAPPLLRSATGTTRFDLKKRRQLKQALIASMVFGPPRAYEQTFHNTIAE